MASDRNPIVIPTLPPIEKRSCSKCKSENFSGTNVSGRIVWTCHEPDCGNQWQTGVGRVFIGPREVYPYDSYVPSVSFNQNPKTAEWEEQRRPVSTVPDFKTGALIPEDEEGDY